MRSFSSSFSTSFHAANSTVIELVANCMDRAKHRRRKAAAKMHLRLHLRSFLLSFAIVDTAGQHDNKRAWEVCATVLAGEEVVFDKAHLDFDHLEDLDARGVWRVTRAKDNMKYQAVKNLTEGKNGITKDQIVSLKGRKVTTIRRVEARVEVDGEERTIVFITNSLPWILRSVCDLYRAPLGPHRPASSKPPQKSQSP